MSGNPLIPQSHLIKPPANINYSIVLQIALVYLLAAVFFFK